VVWRIGANALNRGNWALGFADAEVQALENEARVFSDDIGIINDETVKHGFGRLARVPLWRATAGQP
jgi:hypothetical protein